MIDPTKVVADWEQDYKLMQDQRAEIERLRLTDEERAAIAYAELTLRCETHPVCERHTATLRSLLKRLEVHS
jgi:ubiquinone biosynthesis protein UbiJ